MSGFNPSLIATEINNSPFLQYLGGTSTTMPDEPNITSAAQIGLYADGFTDDSLILQDYLDNNLVNGRIVITSPYAIALYDVVQITQSNLEIIFTCPIFLYGDAGFQFVGSVVEEPLSNPIKLATGYTEATNTLHCDASNSNFSLFQVNDIIFIRGECTISNTAVQTQNAYIQSIDSENKILTLTDNLDDPYQWRYYTPGFYEKYSYYNETYIKRYVGTYCTANITRGDYYITVASTTGFNIGDLIQIVDLAKCKDIYPVSSSTNTCRSEMNKIIQISGSLIYLESAMCHTYDYSHFRIYINKYIPIINSKIYGAIVEYRQNPTSWKVPTFNFLRAENCSLESCTVSNKNKIDRFYVNGGFGFQIKITEDSTVPYTFTASLNQTVYNDPDTFAYYVGKNITSASFTGPNNRTYTVSYSKTTGCFTISVSTGTFTIVNVGTDTTFYAQIGLIGGYTYTGANTYTGQDVRDGLFPVSQYYNKFYFIENVNTITLTIPTYKYSRASLLKTLQDLLNANSPNNWTYSVSCSTDEFITIACNHNFTIPYAIGTIYKYIGFHGSSGTASSLLTGSNSYTGASKVALTSKGMAIRIDRSYNCNVNNFKMGRTWHQITGQGYGIAWYLSSYCIVSNFNIAGARHALTWSSGSNYCGATNGYISGSFNSPIDMHGSGETDITVSNITVVGSSDISSEVSVACIRVGNNTHVMAGRYCVFDNITCYNYMYEASHQRRFIDIINNAQYNTFKNCTFTNGEVGVMLQDTSSLDGSYFLNCGNSIINCTFNNISSYPVFADAHYHGTTLGVGNTLTFKNCVWSGCGNQMLIKNITDCKVIDCTIENYSGSGDIYSFLIRNCPSFLMKGCTINNYPRGIDIYSSAGYMVDRNTFINLTSSYLLYDHDSGNTGYYFTNNEYLKFYPRFSLSGGSTIGRISNANHYTKMITSTLSVGATITNIIERGNITPVLLDGGDLGIAGTYTTFNPYGYLYVQVYIPCVNVDSDYITLAIFSGDQCQVVAHTYCIFSASLTAQCKLHYTDRTTYTLTARAGPSLDYKTLTFNSLFTGYTLPYMVIREEDY